jgi:hypothetical protein
MTALPLAAAAVRLRGKPGRPRKPRPEAPANASPVVVLAPVAPVLPRLLDLDSTAAYLGISSWTVRALESAGTLRRVRVPLANGGELRKLLFDREDLAGLVEVWKDAPPEPAPATAARISSRRSAARDTTRLLGHRNWQA